MQNECENFLKELQALLSKYDMEITSQADAADDTNLQSWLEIEKVTVDKYGRTKYVSLCRLDDCSVSEITEKLSKK